MHKFVELEPAVEQSNNHLGDVTVIMPIGGLATRAREITQDLIPKHLITLGDGRPVLGHVLRGLQQVGFRKFLFCVGHHKSQIIDYIENGGWDFYGSQYNFSIQEKLLGPDGAVRQSVDDADVRGQAMIVPGDMFLPWQGLAEMNRYHRESGIAVTFGVTSHITKRTTDVGKFIVENGTNRLLWCYERTALDVQDDQNGSRGLTSAAAMVVDVAQYKSMIDAFKVRGADDRDGKINFRDDVAPWLVGNVEYPVHCFDVKGEALDLGTPTNIYYGTEHWKHYA